jgi:hypothetical protein
MPLVSEKVFGTSLQIHLYYLCEILLAYIITSKDNNI